MKQLVIFGVSSFAQIAAEYFERDFGYEVTSFVVDDGFRDTSEMLGRQVLTMSEMRQRPLPSGTHFYVAATYTKLNRLRAERLAELRSMGLSPASYISPHAYIDPTALLGDHCFVFEDNTVQPHVKIGDNVILWSGNHIGHHSLIEESVFVSSHVVISGFCEIGQFSFLGVNSTIGNNVRIGRDNWLMPGTVILSDTSDDEMWRPERPIRSSARPREKFL